MKAFDWVYVTFKKDKRKSYGIRHEIDYDVFLLGKRHYLWFFFGKYYKLYSWFEIDKK